MGSFLNSWHDNYSLEENVLEYDSDYKCNPVPAFMYMPSQTRIATVLFSVWGKEISLGIAYLLLTVVGFIANCKLFFLNSFNIFTSHRTRPKNIIIIHLAFSNAMVLLFRGIPTTTGIWRIRCLLDDTGIKIIIYIQALRQNLSLCSTCLLSVFQAIIISPTNSIWAQLKMRASKCIIPCNLLCWISNLLLNMILFQYHDSPKNIIENKYGCNTGYRTLDVYNKNHVTIVTVSCVYDALFMCLMTFSSTYVISILYIHKKNISYIYNNRLSTKISHEAIATQAILLFVGIFVLLNVFSPIFAFCMFHFKCRNTWIIHTSAFLSIWYPVFSPFILISIDNQIHRTCAYRYTENS
ncbi:vomeronasal type-1 receptor 4-like [Sarcophilus harrisii]|uniref:vomeronasal type-1 receptor 4-like n=1 Tax=Sarcophilus harrisii TaxID=9305 RepID=UPI001301F835|nr:vomeronasal type-1 receptor 4-like [Sarcophilus harrisii]